MGIVLGGRLGYALFYGADRLAADPMWLFRVWEGGMAFHGGLLGVLVAMAVFARQRGIDWGRLMDFVAPLTPVGLALGRLGNFIGQELWGRPADVPWAMVFPNDPLGLARHPSQLYQFGLEGCLLFLILLWYSRRRAAYLGSIRRFLDQLRCAAIFCRIFASPMRTSVLMRWGG